ncbi:Phosphatidylserine decarboxylase [hydrothermal vent metagenome]|uniref:Phosphatidylserine decarboxylase n=1 Tax=hydrothermal vent metagenome TaxID=652676 RepID=A0A3B1CBM9_9ZZZZ
MWSMIGLVAFVAYFFRDPKRVGPDGDDLMVAPADGKVAKIDTAYFSEDYPDGAICISIFLSIFNVHVQRIPVAGDVLKKIYNKGKFLAAWNHKASYDNEQNYVALDTKWGKVAIKQIAGLIARRIVCRVKTGQALQKGDRMGLIRFGSRVDLIIPSSAHIVSKVGDKVKGGETVMARARLEVTE